MCVCVRACARTRALSRVALCDQRVAFMKNSSSRRNSQSVSPAFIQRWSATLTSFTRASYGAMPRGSSAAKILFVSNNDGTSFSEVNAIVSVVIVALWVRLSILPFVDRYTQVSQTKRYSTCIERTLDVATLILPSIGCMFTTERAILVSAWALVASCLMLWITQSARAHAAPVAKTHKRTKVDASVAQAFRCDDAIAMYRYTLAILTAVAILAIDFTIFPRRLGKTETFGVSLMDLGGGAFVFSSGVVSRFARGRTYRSFRASMVKVAPLFALGVARWLITTAVGYHSVETEYGRHWNFFFTLACVNVFASILTIPPKKALSLGLCISLVYQCVLSRLASAWVLQAPEVRRHPEHMLLRFASMNREGLCSVVGYYAIYLIAVQIGWFLAQPILNFRRWARTALIVVSALWCAALGLHRFVEPVSRRSGNAAYVMWISAYNMQVILAYVIMSHILWLVRQQPSAAPMLVQAVSTNQLAVFLCGNLLTGLVNLSIDTMQASDVGAWIVMGAYTSTICACALLCHKTNVKRA